MDKQTKTRILEIIEALGNEAQVWRNPRAHKQDRALAYIAICDYVDDLIAEIECNDPRSTTLDSFTAIE